MWLTWHGGGVASWKGGTQAYLCIDERFEVHLCCTAAAAAAVVPQLYCADAYEIQKIYVCVGIVLRCVQDDPPTRYAYIYTLYVRTHRSTVRSCHKTNTMQYGCYCIIPWPTQCQKLIWHRQTVAADSIPKMKKTNNNHYFFKAENGTPLFLTVPGCYCCNPIVTNAHTQHKHAHEPMRRRTVCGCHRGTLEARLLYRGCQTFDGCRGTWNNRSREVKRRKKKKETLLRFACAWFGLAGREVIPKLLARFPDFERPPVACRQVPRELAAESARKDQRPEQKKKIVHRQKNSMLHGVNRNISCRLYGSHRATWGRSYRSYRSGIYLPCNI